MTIRPASREDAAAIAAVHVASWHDALAGIASAAILERNTEPRRRAHWERVLSEAARDVFVATDDDAVVGFVHGGAMPESIRGRAPIPDHDAYVDTLYVLAAWHGRGVGRALLGALAQRLAQRGFRSIALHVLAQNPARGFYERLGGRFICAEPFTDGGDEIVQIAYGWRDISQLAMPAKRRS